MKFEVSRQATSEPRVLFDILEKNASRDRERVAISIPANKQSKHRVEITYGGLVSRCKRLAGGLSSRGITKGSRVGALLPNSIEFIELWFATSLLGAVYVPFNIALKSSLLEFQISDSGTSLLCFDKRLKSNVSSSTLKEMKTLVAVGEKGSDVDSGLNLLEFEALADAQEIDAQKLTVVEPTDPISILYTSGTTGEPKGVVLSHRAYLNRSLEVCDLFRAPDGSVFLNALPLFHTSGQVMTTLPAFLKCGTVVQEEWFHASRFWRVAAESGASYSFLLMTMLNSLLKRKEEFVENSLKAMLCGGATLQVWQEFEASFGVKLLEGYGMTETCGVAIFNSMLFSKLGSIGKPLPSVEAIILDDEDREISRPGEMGEICLRPRITQTMMSEYYNKPDDTSRVWRNGWLHTGDVGYRDSEGFFFFVERKKDIIRRRGENIAPGDIERVVAAHESVLECCAVGLKSEFGEEEVALFLVLKHEIEDMNSFVMWLDRELPFYMMPRYINVVEALPKTANQKVQRSRLKEEEESGKSRAIMRIDLEKLRFRATRPTN